MTPDITFYFKEKPPTIDDILRCLKEHCDCHIYIEEEGEFSPSRAFSVRTARSRKLHILYSSHINEVCFLATDRHILPLTYLEGALGCVLNNLGGYSHWSKWPDYGYKKYASATEMINFRE